MILSFFLVLDFLKIILVPSFTDSRTWRNTKSWTSIPYEIITTLKADASSPDTLMIVYGTGKMNHPNFKLLNPESAGCTGDITVTTSAACNFLIKVIKTSGYGSGIQAYN